MATSTVKPDLEEAVNRASTHLYEALTHKYGPLDVAANQPLVRAIAEYGERSRAGDDEGIRRASEHVFEALTHKFRPLDLGAQEPLVRALSEYGAACRAAGPRR